MFVIISSEKTVRKEHFQEMAEKEVQLAATNAEIYYAELLLAAPGTCRGCWSNFASLSTHLHRGIVKVYCPAPGCYTTVTDTPACVERHWNQAHSHLGPRPRAIRIALRRPKCTTRWHTSEDSHRRDLATAFLDSIAPLCGGVARYG